MASNPQDDIRNMQKALSGLGLSVEKLSNDMKAKMGVAAEALYKNFGSKTQRLKTDFKHHIGEMTTAFVSGQQTMKTSNKSFLSAMDALGATTGRGTSKVIDLKKAMQAIAVIAPKAMGSGMAQAMMMAENTAQKTDLAFMARQALKMHSVEKLVSSLGDVKDASGKAFQMIQTGHGDIAVQAEQAYQREVSMAKNDGQRAAAATKFNQTVRSAVDLSDKKLRIEKEIARSPAEKVAAEFASKRVKTTANELTQQNGILGAISRRSSAMQGLVAAERESVKATAAGGGQTVSMLTGGQVAGQAMLGVMMKMGMAMQTVGGVAGIMMKVVEAFSRGTKSSGAFMSALSSNAQMKAFTGSMSDMAHGAIISGKHIGLIRKEISASDWVSGVSSLNVDNLWQSAAGAAASVGGLGKSTDKVIAGFTRVQILAPLAGMSGEDALQMVERGAKVFRNNDPEKYFRGIRAASIAAGMSLKDFAEAADVENMGKQWGVGSETIINSLMKISAGAMRGAPSAIQGMFVSSMSGLSKMPLENMLGMMMSGNKMSMGSASKKLQDLGPVAGPLAALSNMVQSQRMMPKGDNDREGHLRMAFLLRQAGVDDKLYTFDKQFRSAVNKALSGGAIDDKSVKAIRDAQEKADPIRRAANLAESQVNLLERIANTLDEVVQTYLRQAFGGALKYTDEGKAMIGAPNMRVLAASMETK